MRLHSDFTVLCFVPGIFLMPSVLGGNAADFEQKSQPTFAFSLSKVPFAVYIEKHRRIN